MIVASGINLNVNAGTASSRIARVWQKGMHHFLESFADISRWIRTLMRENGREEQQLLELRGS
jgi:hypothetical protein